MTLSFWMRDYIFFPVRRKLMRASLPAWLTNALPPMVTMLVSGIWHGAGWNFVAWGAWFGILIVLYQAVGIRGDFNPANPFKRFFAWLVMFIFLQISWLLFAAPSLAWLGKALSGPFFGTIQEQSVALLTITLTVLFSIPMIAKHLLDRYVKSDSLLHSIYYAAATIVMIVYVNSASTDFVYFQF